MNNELEQIKVLKNEIETLNNEKERTKSEYADCLLNIENTSDEIKVKKEKWLNNRRFFTNESFVKMCKLILPLSGSIFLLLFCVFQSTIFAADPILGKIFFSLITSSMMTVLISLMFVITFDIDYNYKSKFRQYVSSKIRKRIFKKYPYLEETYNELISLSEELSEKRKKLEQLENDKIVLKDKIRSIEILLNTKKDELIELNDKVFNNLVEENVLVKEEEIDTTNVEKRGKVRVRVPKDN